MKRGGAPPLSPAVPASPVRKAPVRLEKPEDKEKRLAEEQREKAKKEAEEKAKKEAEEKAKREAEEKARREKEEEERKKAEEERVRKEKERHEEERRKKEEEEKALKEAEKAKEEERLRKEEERLKAEEEKVAATGESPTPATVEHEEGELDEPEEAGVDSEVAGEKDETKEKSQDKGVLRIDTALASPDAPRKRHPGPLDLSSTCNQPISQPLPSALATARTIEDLGTVSYLEGIGNPRVELDINAKRDKFRCGC